MTVAMAFTREPDARTAAPIDPGATREKYSAGLNLNATSASEGRLVDLISQSTTNLSYY